MAKIAQDVEDIQSSLKSEISYFFKYWGQLWTCIKHAVVIAITLYAFM